MGSSITVEPDGQSGGLCDCCRTESRTIWGYAYLDGAAVASYHVRWTVGVPLTGHPALFDLSLGPWGEGSEPAQRVAVRAWHFDEDGTTGIMLGDATEAPSLRAGLVGRGARRDEVQGTPLAALAFAVIDAIFLHDGRYPA